jgi:GntR family transcriptional regulator
VALRKARRALMAARIEPGRGGDEAGALRLRALRERMQALAARGRAGKGRHLHDALLDMLAGGYWRPGERLPGERELAQYLAISLGTAQSAMRRLAAAKLVERRRGAGTFVTNADDLASGAWHFRFRSPRGGQLLALAIAVIDIGECALAGPWTEFLQPAAGLIRIRRQVIVGEAFTTWSEVFLDAMRFRPLLDLTPEFLSRQNLRIFLHERYNAPTLRAVHRLRHVTADAGIAPRLRLPEGERVLLMHALGFGYHDAPISFQRIYIPPVDFELEIT